MPPPLVLIDRREADPPSERVTEFQTTYADSETGLLSVVLHHRVADALFVPIKNKLGRPLRDAQGRMRWKKERAGSGYLTCWERQDNGWLGDWVKVFSAAAGGDGGGSAVTTYVRDDIPEKVQPIIEEFRANLRIADSDIDLVAQCRIRGLSPQDDGDDPMFDDTESEEVSQ